MMPYHINYKVQNDKPVVHSHTCFQDQVSLKSIQRFARKHREVVKYMEVSAMTRPSDPAKVFECAAEAVLFGVDEIKRNQDIEDIYDDPKGCFSGLFKK